MGVVIGSQLSMTELVVRVEGPGGGEVIEQSGKRSDLHGKPVPQKPG